MDLTNLRLNYTTLNSWTYAIKKEDIFNVHCVYVGLHIRNLSELFFNILCTDLGTLYVANVILLKLANKLSDIDDKVIIELDYR